MRKFYFLYFLISTFCWSQTNTFPESGNVGIGTKNPTARLAVTKDGGIDNLFRFESLSDDGGKIYSSYEKSSPYLNFIEYDDPFVFNFLQTKDNVSVKMSFHKGNVAIGTIDPGSWKLAVNGKIRAKEIKVETNWSDFVFKENYNLPTLEEVEKHIKEKGHLKDIPSAKEVEKNGIYLGEMDAKLLQKIEELMLYTIEQQKMIGKLREENKDQFEIIGVLQNELKQLKEKL